MVRGTVEPVSFRKGLEDSREILVEQITIFDEMYHMNGPIEYTPRRMQWLLDHGKGHDVISERTGMPIGYLSPYQSTQGTTSIIGRPTAIASVS